MVFVWHLDDIIFLIALVVFILVVIILVVMEMFRLWKNKREYEKQNKK